MNRQTAQEVRALIVEFLGPFALVFAGAGAIIQTGGQNLVAIAFAHGLAIGLFVAAAGHVSGGVYNPAIAVGLVVARKLAPARAAGFIVAELLGGTVAALFLKAIYPADQIAKVALGAPAIGAGVSVGAAFFLEIILTFFLQFVIYGTAVDERGPRAIASLAIGLTITMDILLGGGISGAVMNPARQFGPALIAGAWTNWWIWWLGPIIGAALAAGLYAYVLEVQGEVAQPDTLDPDLPRDRRV